MLKYQQCLAFLYLRAEQIECSVKLRIKKIFITSRLLQIPSPTEKSPREIARTANKNIFAVDVSCSFPLDLFRYFRHWYCGRPTKFWPFILEILGVFLIIIGYPNNRWSSIFFMSFMKFETSTTSWQQPTNNYLHEKLHRQTKIRKLRLLQSSDAFYYHNIFFINWILK